MRNWFLTSAFLSITVSGFVIFLGFLAFLQVARHHLKVVIDQVYPDSELMLSTEKQRKKNIKEQLRKKLFTQETSTTSDREEMDSDEMVTSELRRQIMSKSMAQESSTEEMGLIQSWLIFILKALFD